MHRARFASLEFERRVGLRGRFEETAQNDPMVGIQGLLRGESGLVEPVATAMCEEELSGIRVATKTRVLFTEVLDLDVGTKESKMAKLPQNSSPVSRSVSGS